MFTDGSGRYDVEKLWVLSKDLKITNVKTSLLRHNLEETDWQVDDITDNRILSVNDILRNLPLYPHHQERVEQANLQYPILISPRMEIYDGMHRLCKCILEKKRFIRCKVIPYAMLEATRISDYKLVRSCSV